LSDGIRRELATIRVRGFSGRIAEDAGGSIGAAAAIAIEGVAAGLIVVGAVVDTIIIADTTADTRRSGGHN
jgi:hypothetical protein